MSKKLDIYSLQIVSQYLKLTQDFLNLIQVNKKNEFILDRLRINPIPINEQNKNLFQFIQTQQLFSKNDIKLQNIKIYQYNYEIDYEKYLEIIKDETKIFKFKKINYTQENRKKYGNTIPKEITIIGEKCFANSDINEIIISFLLMVSSFFISLTIL